MLKREQARQFLAANGWLSVTAPSFRESVLDRISLRELADGEAAYRAGDPQGGLWAVVEGAVEIEIPPFGAAPQLVHVALPGFWVGEAPLVHDQVRKVSLVAAASATLATVPLADCRAMLAAEPAGWRWVAVLTYLNSELAIGILADQLLRDPKLRAAAFLLRLGGLRGPLTAPRLPLPIRITQEKLGRMINLSRNPIHRVLREFEERGWIRLAYGEVAVLDAAGLTSLLEAGEGTPAGRARD